MAGKLSELFFQSPVILPPSSPAWPCLPHSPDLDAPQAILVHQLSRQLTQAPFRRNKGRAVRVEFHPTKPFFFVATQNHVRVYNLARQALAKKLECGGGIVTALAVHPSGDHVIVGTEVGCLFCCRMHASPSACGWPCVCLYASSRVLGHLHVPYSPNVSSFERGHACSDVG